jgi:hypothetical protein
MPEKPTTAAGYKPEQVARVRATCLYLATKLGDLMDDLVVVGGLVPSLLIDQGHLPAGVAAYVGTMDLDLGLAFAVVGEQRYQAITERLRRAGFAPDVNEEGNPTRQRWRISDPPVTVDFLIEPANATEQAGRVFSIERDFAAIIAPGLHLAFVDRSKVTLDGLTIQGEKASREIWVCGPGAYVALKALAFRIRGENKDAYDLFYVVRNYGNGVADVAARLKPLVNDKSTKTALDYLRADFLDHEATGPRRVAEFMYGREDANTQADVVGFVRELLDQCGSSKSGT